MTDPVFDYDGLRYRVHRDVYDPSDDTFLLIDVVKRQPPGRLLELGTGSGLVALAATRAGHRVTATDVSSTALALAASNARLNGLSVVWLRADGVRGVDVRPFDAIAWNPPYLPTAEQDHLPGPLDRAFDGGLDGRGVVRRVLADLPADAPPLFVVASTLQDLDALGSDLSRLGFDHRPDGERRLPHERLVVFRVTRKG